MDRASDGFFYSGGGTYSQSATQRVALWKIDLSGNITMLAEYGDEGYEQFARQAIQAKDGGFLLVGESDVSDIIDVGVFKFSADGTFEWSHTYGKPDLFDFGFMADTTWDDGFFIGARTCPSFEDRNFWVLRITATGDTVWTKEWGTPLDDGGTFLSTKANGNPLISGGWPYAPEQSLMRAYQAELDEADGSFVWQREYGPINSGYLFAAKEVGPGLGHIAVGYQTEAPSTTLGNLLRTADNGDSLWMRNYYYVDSLLTDGEGVLYDVITTLDGGFIACGTAIGSASGNLPTGYTQDAWVVKVDSLGCIIPGCANSTAFTTQVTNLSHVLNVYPNPLSMSSGQAQLHVGIALPAHFTTQGPLVISVTGPEGKLVKQQHVPASLVGELVLDMHGLAAGAYSLHLSDAHTWIAGKKFIIE